MSWLFHFFSTAFPSFFPLYSSSLTIRNTQNNIFRSCILEKRERKRKKVCLFVIIYYTYYLLVNGTFTTLFLWLPLWNLDGFLTAFVVGSSGRHSVYHLLLHQNGTYICLSIHPCPYKFFLFVPMCVVYAYAFTFIL